MKGDQEVHELAMIEGSLSRGEVYPEKSRKGGG